MSSEQVDAQRPYDTIPGVTERISIGVLEDGQPYAARTLLTDTAFVHADGDSEAHILKIGDTDDMDTICAMLTDQRDWLRAQQRSRQEA